MEAKPLFPTHRGEGGSGGQVGGSKNTIAGIAQIFSRLQVYTAPEGQGIRVSLLSRAGVGSFIHVNIPETPPVWLAMLVPVIKRETDVGPALKEQTVL